MTRLKKTIFKFYGVLVLTLILIFIFLFFELSPQDLKFYVFNVGQGDAIFIRTMSRYNILIDGGADNSVVYKLGQYLPFYDRQIDLMILTHPHSDHIVGLVEVLKRYQVKKIFTTGVLYSSPDYSAWQKAIAERQIPVEIIDKPRALIINNGSKLEILFPDHNLENKKIKNVNNASIVTKLIYGKIGILLMGDYEDEEKLAKTSWDLSADIIKIGHHGSTTANDQEFLAKTNSAIRIRILFLI